MSRTREATGKDVIQDAGQDERVTERVRVAVAAERLGITKEAVHKRLSRGTLRSDRDPDGTGVRPPSSTPSGTPPASDALVDELRDRLRFVERKLEAERQAHAEAQRIIGGLVQRIPELEAPQEPRERPESAGEGAGTPVHSTGGPQEARERPFTEEEPEPRSWWRRVFGG